MDSIIPFKVVFMLRFKAIFETTEILSHLDSGGEDPELKGRESWMRI